MNFIIPIRHPASVLNKQKQYEFLLDLFRSISAQTDRNFRCFVVVNYEQHLPELPEKFQRLDVNIPHFNYRQNAASTGEIHNYFRMDKGRRVAAAFDFFDHKEPIMIVDDDDLLSRDLCGFVNSEKFEGIFVVDRGYGWKTGSETAFLINQFHRICGSSVILPACLYKYARPGKCDLHEAYRELGSHRIIVTDNARGGIPIKRVPFRASIYRRDHENSEETQNDRYQRNNISNFASCLLPARRLKNRLLSNLKENLSGKPPIIYEHRVMEWRRVRISRLRDEFFG